MGSKKNIFQIGLLMLFGLFAVVGIAIIATNKNDSNQLSIRAPIIIWGPASDSDAIRSVLNDLSKDNESFKKVYYVGKNPDTMYAEILESIATGKNPDLVILSSSDLLPLRNKILPISFETLPIHTFRDTYVEGSEIFVFSDAIYALPILVDPLVLYWNRDLFANSAIAQVPKNWDTFVDTVPRLSHIVNGSELTQSAIAFGEYDNVLHAKEILSALLMQTGINIVSERNNKFVPSFGLSQSSGVNPELALKFYVSFSNPVKTVYSWNKMFDRSREEFAANNVAMYVGFASEENVLKEINPNLNFDMAVFPQSLNSNRSITYGNFEGLSLLRASKQPRMALYVARVLSNADNSSKLSKLTGLPSARRDVLNKENPADPFDHVKVQSAIISKTWLEPAPKSQVDDIFARTVNSIVAGNVDESTGINQMMIDLKVLLEQYNGKDK